MIELNIEQFLRIFNDNINEYLIIFQKLNTEAFMEKHLVNSSSLSEVKRKDNVKIT